MRNLVVGLFLSIFFCVTYSLSACAQDLLAIYDQAVKNNPDIRKNYNEYRATREKRPQARSQLLPSVNVSGSIRRTDEKVRSSEVPVWVDDDYSAKGVSVAARQPLFDATSWLRLKQTSNLIAGSLAQYRNQTQDLMVRTAEAYFGVLRAADLVSVRESELKALSERQEQVNTSYRVGMVALTEVNEVTAEYDRARAGLLSAQNDYDNAWEALQRIAGQVNAPLSRLADSIPLVPPMPNDLQAWARQAQRSSLLIRAAAESRNAEKKSIDIARSSRLPKLNLDAGYDAKKSRSVVKGGDSRGGYVGLSVSMPLFEGGLISSQTREATYRHAAAEQQLDVVRRQVDQSTKKAFRGIITSIEVVRAQQAAVKSAQTKLQSMQEGEQVGTRTQLDVLDAMRAMYNAEASYLTARYDYILSSIKLHQATSTLTREVLINSNALLDSTKLVQPPNG